MGNFMPHFHMSRSSLPTPLETGHFDYHILQERRFNLEAIKFGMSMVQKSIVKECWPACWPYNLVYYMSKCTCCTRILCKRSSTNGRINSIVSQFGMLCSYMRLCRFTSQQCQRARLHVLSGLLWSIEHEMPTPSSAWHFRGTAFSYFATTAIPELNVTYLEQVRNLCYWPNC